MDTQVSAPFRQLASGHGYEVLELIDQGGFGDIFTVRPIASPKSPVLALKRLNSRRHVTEDDIILDEIRAMLALHHRHIVRIRDVILDGHVACIVMDLAGLGNLEALLKGDRSSGSSGTGPDSKEVEAHFGEDFVVRIFSQLLSALVFCHSRNVAHRDLQPANVLLLSWRRAVLADFGLATPLWDPLGNPATCRDFLGRDPYLAPEVRGHVPYRPGPSDIWSLGCLLVFLTTRNHPDPQVLDSRVGQADKNLGLCNEVPNGEISSGQISVSHVSENLLSCNHNSICQLPIDHPSSDAISNGHVSNTHLSQDQASSEQFVHHQLSMCAPSNGHLDAGHLSHCEQLSGEFCSGNFSLTVRVTLSDSSTADPSGGQSIDDHRVDIEQICRPRESEESGTLEATCDQVILPNESTFDACSPRPGPDTVSMSVNQHDTQDNSENIVNNNNTKVITANENASREQSANQDSVLDDVSRTTSSKENACGRGEKLNFDHDETQQAISDSRDSGRGLVSVSTVCQNEHEQTSCSFSPLFHSCPVCSSPSTCLFPSLMHLCCRMVDVLCKKCPDDRLEVENAEEVWRCAVASLRFHA